MISLISIGQNNRMVNNEYIIKSPALCAIDELIVFSELTTFNVIFLRKQDDFYNDAINTLKTNNSNVYGKPFGLKFFY